jgi:hypothetical protein
MRPRRTGAPAWSEARAMSTHPTAVQRQWHGKLPQERPPQIPGRQWEILTLHVRDEVPYVELAERFGITPPVVRELALIASRLLVLSALRPTEDLSDVPQPILAPLIRAGYRTRAAVARASDEELLAVHRIGAAGLRRLRALIPHEPRPDPPGGGPGSPGGASGPWPTRRERRTGRGA